MNDDLRLDRALENLAGLLKPPGSVVEQVMQRLERDTVPTDSPPLVGLAGAVRTDGATGVACGAHLKPGSSDRRHTPGRFLTMIREKPLRWSVAAALAAAIVLLITFWPGDGGARSGGLVWADVLQQFQTARTARLRVVQIDPTVNGGQEVLQDLYIKSPGMIRMESTHPRTQQEVIVIVNCRDAAILHPAEKRYQPASNDVIPISSAADILGMFTAPAAASEDPGSAAAQSRPAFDGGIKWRLVSEGMRERDGRKLERYRLDQFAPDSAPQTVGGHSGMYLWQDITTNKVVLLTHERTVDGKTQEVVRTEVQLDVELSDDLFNTERPRDYADATADKVELKKVFREYEQHRDGIKRYRLIQVREGEESGTMVPVRRCVRDGASLRMDGVDTHVIPADLSFDEMWSRLVRQRLGISIFMRGGKIVRVLWNGDKPVSVLNREDEDSEMGKYTLAGLGWPKLPMSLFATLMLKSSSYEVLPPRADRPGLIGIRYSSEPHGEDQIACMEVFWMDPTRDYLCVHHETHQRQGAPWAGDTAWQPREPLTTERPEGPFNQHDGWREIIEFGRTPEGRWYPTRVRSGSAVVVDGRRSVYDPIETRIVIDFSVSVPDDFFDAPAAPAE